MNPDTDYYSTLGVLDDAEDIVIKAAYRALAQRYHPDRWKGDPTEANRRMADINAAYEILSDPTKRAAYDARRDKSKFRSDDSDTASDDDTSSNSAVNRDWEIAKKYHPGIAEIEQQLKAISRTLGFTYKLTLLESKRFADSSLVATELEQRYLSKYFGNSPKTQAFAKELILEGRRDAAKELNDAVRVLGEVGPDVIARIARDFKTARARSKNVFREYQTTPAYRKELALRIVGWLRERNYSPELLVSYVREYAECFNNKIDVEIRDKRTLLLGTVTDVGFFLWHGSEKRPLAHDKVIDWILRDSQ